MERNWIKKCFTFVVLVVVGMGMFAGSAEAQEVSSISVEEQMIVDELAKQVAQLAEQVNELSLMVSKYVLEQQALVLVEQLEGMTGDSIAIVDVQAMVEEEPAPFAMIEESAKEVMEDSKTEEVVVEEIPTFVEEISTEDVFANIEIDEALVLGNTESKESGERQQRGFLAALSSFRDGLGRPELRD
jgi:outer membrane murein-binding lipoprotein Lpp